LLTVSKCLERDGGKCVVTGRPHPDVAHVFPFCMLKWKGSPMEERLFEFWNLLSLFWPEEKIDTWKARVFPTDEGRETCRNMLCLDPTVYRMWTKGLFAFKPLHTSEDPNELSLQFVWQPQYGHNRGDRIDIMTTQKPSRGLTGSSGSWLAFEGSNESLKKVETGDVFKIRSNNLDTHPLPDLEILEMQWVLQRLVSMSGAAGWADLEDGSDSTLPNGEECLLDRQSISKWVSDAAACNSHQYDPFRALEERPVNLVSAF
jgi:hypothetical protein